MAKKRLIPAPLDGKNVTTDWIEELFDEQSALYGSHKMLGFMAGATVQASWCENRLLWTVLDGDPHDAFRCLDKRYLERYPDADSPFVVRENIRGKHCLWGFYWKSND